MNIEVFPDIYLGQTDIPIRFTSQAVPLEAGHYQIWEYEFEGCVGANGCFFILPPDAQTAAGLITDPNTIVTLETTFGTGKYISTRDVTNLVDAQRAVTNTHAVI